MLKSVTVLFSLEVVVLVVIGISGSGAGFLKQQETFTSNI
jgi:hypothetical protein